MTPEQLLADPWAFGPWCWVVDDVRLLAEPTRPRGMQGLWPLSLTDVQLLSELAGAEVTSAMTLQQPFATAIAIGPKRVENRPWRRTIPPGGLWVGLHAGKTLYVPRGGTVPSLESYVARMVDAWRTEMWPDAPELESMPRGLLLGVMHVASIEPYPGRA